MTKLFLLQPITEKNTRFFYIYTSKAENKTYSKPNASQDIHLPIQLTPPLTFNNSDNEIKSPSTRHQYFNTRFNSTFKFLQVYQKIKTEPNSCSVIFQNKTHHSAILSQGYFGFT